MFQDYNTEGYRPPLSTCQVQVLALRMTDDAIVKEMLKAIHYLSTACTAPSGVMSR